MTLGGGICSAAGPADGGTNSGCRDKCFPSGPTTGGAGHIGIHAGQLAAYLSMSDRATPLMVLSGLRRRSPRHRSFVFDESRGELGRRLMSCEAIPPVRQHASRREIPIARSGNGATERRAAKWRHPQAQRRKRNCFCNPTDNFAESGTRNLRSPGKGLRFGAGPRARGLVASPPYVSSKSRQESQPSRNERGGCVTTIAENPRRRGEPFFCDACVGEIRLQNCHRATAPRESRASDKATVVAGEGHRLAARQRRNR